MLALVNGESRSFTQKNFLKKGKLLTVIVGRRLPSQIVTHGNTLRSGAGQGIRRVRPTTLVASAVVKKYPLLQCLKFPKRGLEVIGLSVGHAPHDGIDIVDVEA